MVPFGHFSGWAGSVALAILVIPVVARTTEDMLLLVPNPLREAASAMGLPRAHMIMRVAYRAARAGIVTGMLLAFARVSGETAPLLFTALEQPVLEHRPVATDRQPASRHLPIRAQPLQGMATIGLDRRPADHPRGAGAEHSGQDDRLIKDRQMIGNGAAVDGAVKVSIRDLKFFYGDNLALKGISLPLRTNKVTAFIGPSGCGKSTLLRVLNRMYDLYPRQRAEGEVLLDGENILKPDQDLNHLRARIGMVFQKPTPFPMSIYDNIAFGIKLYEPLSKVAMSTPVSRKRCRALRCGPKSRTSSTPAASAFRAVSSSACASPAPWRSSPR